MQRGSWGIPNNIKVKQTNALINKKEKKTFEVYFINHKNQSLSHASMYFQFFWHNFFSFLLLGLMESPGKICTQTHKKLFAMGNTEFTDSPSLLASLLETPML